MAEHSALLAELIPESQGDPKKTSSFPLWFAYFVEWIDIAAQSKDHIGLANRLRVAASKVKPTERLAWTLKASVLPDGPARDECEARSMGGKGDASPGDSVSSAALSESPHSLVHLLAHSEGYVTRAIDSAEAESRIQAARDEQSVRMKAALAALEAWQS